MSNSAPTIFLSAAESSGDEHAAGLIEALRARIPEARFVGVAGSRMAAAGCEVLADLTADASMLHGPIFRLGYWARTVKRLRRMLRDVRPDVHVPVDSPALNWHLAAAARSCGASVMYYIAPQVWAWAPWRVKKLARLTDRVACILPFEQEYLRARGVNATYVGHPLFETVPARPTRPPDLTEAWLAGTWRVALLPGSRPREIHSHAPAMLDAARAIRRRWPAAECTFAARDQAGAERIRRTLGRGRLDGIAIQADRTREILQAAHFAVVVSGTATLQAACCHLPMVIVYRVSRPAYALIGRWLIQTPHLSLVNILAGRRIVPELMPWHGSRRQLTATVLEMMEDIGWLCETRRALTDLTDTLSPSPYGTASRGAAELVMELLDRRGRQETAEPGGTS